MRKTTITYGELVQMAERVKRLEEVAQAARQWMERICGNTFTDPATGATGFIAYKDMPEALELQHRLEQLDGQP